MIKMGVYYPADGGSKFDHDCYRTHHMPLIQDGSAMPACATR